MCLVSHDRSADRAAPLLQIALGFFQVGLPGEVVRGRDLRVGEVAEHDAPELVCALFRDGVNDRARRTAELRVVLVRQHLELLHRLDRRSRLAADAAAERVVGVVPAVEGHIVALARLAARDDGVVAKLVRWQELDAW